MPSLLCLFAFLLAITPIMNLDFWWHIAVGRLLWENGILPDKDLFSHTAQGLAWDNKEWLFDVILYLVVKHLGITSATLFKALLVAIWIYLVYRVIEKQSAQPALSALFSIIILYSSRLIFTERPWLVTILFEALFLLILLDYKDVRTPYVWMLPLLMVLWVNLHPGAVIGLFIVFCFLLDELIQGTDKSKREPGKAKPVIAREMFSTSSRLFTLAVVFLAVAVAILVNPVTFKRYTAPVELFFLAGDYTAVLNETQAPTLTSHSVFFILLALCIIMWLLFITKTRPSQAVLLCFFGLAALFWQRNIPLFSTASAFLIGSSIRQLSRLKEPDIKHFLDTNRIAIQLIAIMLLALGCILLPCSDHFGLGVNLSVFPDQALDFMRKNHLEGNLYNIYDWGSYLMWKGYPQYKVFIDGRGPDVYPMRIWRDYQSIQRGDDRYSQLLDKYEVELVLVSTADRLQRLINRLNSDGNWTLAFGSYTTRLYVRDKGVNAGFVEVHKGISRFWELLPGEPDKAFTLMQNLVDKYPYEAHGYYHLGIYYGQATKDYKRAIEMFNKAIKLAPNFADAYNNLAVVYSLIGDHENALKSLQDGLKAAPDSRILRQNLNLLKGKMRTDGKAGR